VTRSFTKKVNLGNHDENRQYESVDFFASHNESIPIEEATPEKIKEVSERLYQLAKSEVELAEIEYLNGIKNGKAPILTSNDIAQITDIIILMESAVTTADIQKAVDVINERKGILNKKQLDYLRSVAKNAKAKTLK